MRNLFWLLPLLLALGWPLYGERLSALLAPPALPDHEAGQERQSPAAQRFTMEQVRFFQEIDGELGWRADSRRLRTGESEDEFFLTGVHAVFYRDGAEQVWIDADRGRYDLAGEVLELEDDVRLLDADGFSLLTQALSYFEREGRVASRVGVEIAGEDLQARGRHLDYFLADGRYELTGEVEFITSSP
ncbi:LPS export ABC transporter periplasmic protein LptC [Desulfurivibrio dismutans]|uniref:LPS export ABC transporter periplasmic protein LptC n=1 Tax=Desulfurivibrio dismutans TaxID=1398908 RepID=UPI0023DA503A|nr:LPS export ABC transporter periplasmic protein LptC [Desulfurivibrio alkaliphilus]MDF1613591.1 LPS export ABC transporter periplasmic protein LptC [Desulfurivibrio alkaliphilus]